MTCDGSCDKHVGEVRRVHVIHPAHDWGEFWYCDTAIDEDRRRELTVEIVEVNHADHA